VWDIFSLSVGYDEKNIIIYKDNDDNKNEKRQKLLMETITIIITWVLSGILYYNRAFILYV